MRAINETLNTDGGGYWSSTAKEVRIIGLDVPYIAGLDEEEDEAVPQFGELRVYFDGSTWDTDEHGLIYTDDQFERELQEFLTRAGYDATDVGYSEQGMQGDTYVSLDVGPNFLRTWIRP